MRLKALLGALLAFALVVAPMPMLSHALAAGGDPNAVDFDPRNNPIGSGNKPLTGGSFKNLSFLVEGDDPVTITLNLTNLALGFLGILSLMMMTYAGFKWFLAGDNEEDIESAKQVIIGAVVGLTITLASLGIAQLVFRVVNGATGIQTTSSAWQQVAEWFVPAASAATLPFDPGTNKVAVDSTSAKGLSWPKLTTINLGTRDPLTLIISLINIALSLLATVFLFLILKAAVEWVLARGNEEEIMEARTALIHAVTGLVIILGSYGLATLIFAIIGFVTGSGPLGVTPA